MNNAQKIYKEWQNTIADEKIIKQLEQLSEQEIESAFWGQLNFGTAGMRGVMGLGTNKINTITVCKLAFAVSQYLLLKYQNPSIVICFDTRNNSKQFSRMFAKVTSNMNIKTHLYKNFCPTPIMTYSISELNATMGIMITASHNSKEYNGIKISDCFGIQISGEIEAGIAGIYNNCNEIEVYNTFFAKKLNKNVYFVKNNITEQFLNYGTNKKEETNLKMVYTPLNGTGLFCVSKLLKQNGFKFSVPKLQKKPSGNFETCPYPNPEFIEAFAESLKLAKTIDADLIIATDPDADRIGVCVKNGNDYVKLSGNEVGYILLESRKEIGGKDKFAVATVVTSPLFDAICNANNINFNKQLTGFKNIGKQLQQMQNKFGKENYVLAYEESCGYILRDDIYDKDAVFATLEIAKIARQLKLQGKTLYLYLQEIYSKYGYTASITDSIKYGGEDATLCMNKTIDTLRKNPLKEIANEQVLQVTDFNNDETGLEKQNFLLYKTKNFTLIVRPSGTEPKLKIYIYATFATGEEANLQAQKVQKCIREILV